jgi:phosphatidylinositol-3,4,5-trisphosphate 3-phosphatase/dual-specificity protein phosphatase PTEN
MKAEEIMNEVSEIEDHATASIGDESDIPPSTSTTPRRKPKPEAQENSPHPPTGQTHDTGAMTGKSTLDQVLQLHTSRRMKKGRKSQGVSIPSQRRWLRYWSEILDGATPKQLQFLQTDDTHPPKARLYGINIRMKESGVGTTISVVRVANMLLDRASRRDPAEDDRGAGDVWVSLARYEDKMVLELEKRVRENVAFEYESDGVTSKNPMFGTPKWDDKKMVQSFARLGMAQGNHPQIEKEAEDTIVTYSLVPIPSSEWIDIGGETESSAVEMNDGIALDSSREVRVKLYMGQVSDDILWLLLIID